MNKNCLSKNGSNVEGNLLNLVTSISIARGVLATLSLADKEAFSKKLARTQPEHLRILLSEAMEEIWSADSMVQSLMENLQVKL